LRFYKNKEENSLKNENIKAANRARKMKK